MSNTYAHSSSSRQARSPRGRKGWVLAIVLLTLAVVGVSRAAASPTSAPINPPAAGPLSIVSVNPADGTTGLPSDATISVQFSVPLSPRSPAPTLTPPVAGSWQVVTPTTYAFVASAPLVPSSTETVSVPAGPTGVESTTGKRLGQPSTVQFTVAPGSTLRLQQLLE